MAERSNAGSLLKAHVAVHSWKTLALCDFVCLSNFGTLTSKSRLTPSKLADRGQVKCPCTCIAPADAGLLTFVTRLIWK